ncbi:MAG: hypothetical protein QXV12_00385 [Candidatus Rehaiarchaeum fermentans]|nr:hypothetical protein [Candidatus Rehaiarchaeum fermentans]
MDGELIFLSTYSLAKDESVQVLRQILKKEEELVQFTKAIPEEIQIIEMPTIFKFKNEKINIKNKTYDVKVQLALYNIGDISIRLRINFTNEEELEFLNENEDEIKGKLIEKIIKELNNKLISLNDKLTEEKEEYKIFALNCLPEKVNRKWLAGLLLKEKNWNNLSKQYVDHSLQRKLSYLKSEVVYVDWDGMIIIGESNYEEEIIVCEIANVQLLELRLYNDLMDNFLTNLIKEIKKNQGILSILLYRRRLEKLSEEISRFYDDLQEILNKIDNAFSSFGDWYLAKLYSLFSESFRLKDWKYNITSNLEVIDTISSFIQNKVTNSVNESLEWIIILLIVVEIILEILKFVKL